MEDSSQSLQSRAGAGVFGVVLLLSGALAGFFGVIPLIAPKNFDGTAAIIIGLFVPMSLVLLGAGWNLLTYATTGRRGPLLNRYSLGVFAVVLGALMLLMLFMAADEGDAEMGLGVLSMGGWFAVILYRYFRTRPRADREAAARALADRPSIRRPLGVGKTDRATDERSPAARGRPPAAQKPGCHTYTGCWLIPREHNIPDCVAASTQPQFMSVTVQSPRG